MKRPIDPIGERTHHLTFQVTPDTARQLKLRAIAADMSQAAYLEFLLEQERAIESLLRNRKKLA